MFNVLFLQPYSEKAVIIAAEILMDGVLWRLILFICSLKREELIRVRSLLRQLGRVEQKRGAQFCSRGDKIKAVADVRKSVMLNL